MGKIKYRLAEAILLIWPERFRKIMNAESVEIRRENLTCLFQSEIAVNQKLPEKGNCYSLRSWGTLRLEICFLPTTA